MAVGEVSVSIVYVFIGCCSSLSFFVCLLSHLHSFTSYVPRRRDANRKAVIAAAGTILIGIVCVIAVFGVHPYASTSALYDDSENVVIADQANDALKNAGVEVDMENHNAFEKAELEKTFTQAIKEQKDDKVVAKRNWEASKSKKSSSSKSSSKKSSAHASAHPSHHL